MRTGQYAINFLITLTGILMAVVGHAGEVDVTDVSVDCNSGCDFNVTLRHDDEGWKHYANRWTVLTPDGKVLGTRVLYHPHVNEQPFTRSLSGVKIPDGITEVIVRGHDLVHKEGGREMRVKLPSR